MTRKHNAATLLNDAAAALERQATQLAKFKALSRGDRLRKAEAEVKAAAKPKTLAGKGAALRAAEAEVAAHKRDPRCVWRGMRSS